MKAIKIILAVAVVAGIAFFVIRSLQHTEEVDEISTRQNQFVMRIQQKIQALKNLPNTNFSKNLYDEITYYINYDHNNGYLGSTTLENDAQKKNLNETLYAVYAEKFIKEAFYVFNNSEWKVSDLNFIRTEYQDLRASNLLEQGSPVDRKFSEIASIFTKYDEIVGFISECNNFSYSEYDTNSNFPISQVGDYISRANSYLSSNLGNQYVKNCSRLRNGLQGVPEALFWKHVNYLDYKLDQWSGRYAIVINQPLYANNIYHPLKNQIDQLHNNVYDDVYVAGAYNKLMTKLNEDNRKAYNHFDNQ